MPQMQNRVQETTTTGGTGTLTLSGAVTGYITFASGFSTGTSLFYTIDNGVGEWEIGIGVLVTTGTLSRVTVIASSNGGALVNFGSGTKRVFCSAPTRSLVPDQDSNSGKVLTTDGTNPAWTQTLNGITIGNLTAAAGAFTTLSASSTVSGTGFSTYLASPPAIGGTTPAAGNFTTLGATGNTTLGDAAGDTLTINAGTTTFAGTGQRITGDFSNATTANRLMFQTSTVNGNTLISAIPNGTATNSFLSLYNNSNSTNASRITIVCRATTTEITSTFDGTGTYLPILFNTGGREAMRIGATAGSDLSSLGIGYTSLSGVGEYGLAVSGKVGIGTSSPVYPLDIMGNAGAFGWNIRGRALDGISAARFANNSNTETVRLVAFADGTFTISNTASVTERMRIDYSGNVGIGTASALGTWGKLRIAGTGYVGLNVGSDDASGVNFVVAANSSSDCRVGTLSNHRMDFYTNNIPRMVIANSGDVRMGDVSAVEGSGRYFDVYNTGSNLGSFAIIRLVTQQVASSATTSVDILKAKNGAFVINNNDTHSAVYTGFGVGGTERMRIDSSGNVGIGTSTPNSRLGVFNSQADGAQTLANSGLLFGQTGGWAQAGMWPIGSAGFAGSLVFGTAPSGSGSFSVTERMRIDSSGNVGIGLPSPTQKLDLFDATTVAAEIHTASYGVRVGANSTFGGYIGSPYADTTLISANQKRLVVTAAGNYEFKQNSNTANTSISFNTTVQNALTLDASGNLLVGGTPALGTFTCYGAIMGQRNPSAPAGRHWKYYIENTASNFYIINENNTGVSLVNGTTAWVANSDERLKTALKPIQNAVQKVSTLRAVTGRFKTDEEDVSRSFLIAQDIQAVLPEAVSIENDEMGTLGLRYTETIPLLVAAIKELHTEIETLKQRIH